MNRRKFIQRLTLGALILFALSLALPYVMGGKVKTLNVQTAALETLLGDMAWVSPAVSQDRALYQISFRTCPACINYYKTEFPKLQEMGVDTRLFVFARAETPEQNPNEWAVTAQLYETRSWELAQTWWDRNSPNRFYAKEMDGIAPALGDAARTALVQNGRDQIGQLGNILAANNIDMATPTLLWQDRQGQWKVIVGNNPVTNAQIRKDLGNR